MRVRSVCGFFAAALVSGLGCASEPPPVAPTVRAAPRAPAGRFRCEHAIEHRAIADGPPGDFLVIRSEVDGYALLLPGARDWRVRCDNPPASSGSPADEQNREDVVLTVESVSRANVIEMHARPPRDTDDEGRLVPSAYLRTAARLAQRDGAVANPVVMSVSGVSVGEYDIESTDPRSGQRIRVHHVRAVRPRSDGRVLDLDLRSLPSATDDPRDTQTLRYGAANFADPDAVPSRAPSAAPR